MNTPTLIGQTIRLVPLSFEHLPALEEAALHPSNWQYMTTMVRSRADLRSWVESALAAQEKGSAQVWLTLPMCSEIPIGSTRFADLDLIHRTTELGHTWLAPDHRGTGINTQAKLLQLTYAFETLKLKRVAFKTHHENLRSQAALRKLGAKEEGTFRNHYIMPDGTTRHSVWFSIIDTDWPSIKPELVHKVSPCKHR